MTQKLDKNADQHLSREDIKIHDQRIAYQGYAKVHEVTFSHPTFGGDKTLTVTREIFESENAVVIVPFDPARNEICLIEQLRMGPLMAGDHPWVIEAIAGRIDKGTTAEEIAIKEAQEEAGCQVSDLIDMGTYFQSPGIFAEQITYFLARADLSNIGGTHGLESENEDIRPLTLDLSHAFDALDAGDFVSAPTALALLLMRSRLNELSTMWHS